MSSKVSVSEEYEEFRNECLSWIGNRLWKIRKLNTDYKWVKRPPTEEDFGRMKSIVASIRRNYNLLSDVLRFLGELNVLSKEELNKYLDRLFSINVYYFLELEEKEIGK